MKIYLDKSKPFFKANMHTHTTNSDGRATPEEIKREYKKRGYSVVAFTDHEVIIDNSHLTDDDFIAITGYELEVVEPGKIWCPDTRQSVRVSHLNMYARDPHNIKTLCMSEGATRDAAKEILPMAVFDGRDDLRVWSGEGISKIIDYAHENGFLVCYNHPSWSLESAKDFLEYKNLDFVEIFNTGAYKSGLHNDEHLFDTMVKNDKNVGCFAADDNHNVHGFDGALTDSFGGFIMINSEKLDYDSIIEALEKHDFYASCGPEIHSLTSEGDTVYVETSPVKVIVKQTEGRQGGALIAENGEYITRASFKMKEHEKKFRIIIEDEYGKRAYSQCYELSMHNTEE